MDPGPSFEASSDTPRCLRGWKSGLRIRGYWSALPLRAYTLFESIPGILCRLRAVSSGERTSPRGAERPSPAETAHKRTAYARREIGIGPTLLLLSLVWPAVAAEHRGKCAGAWFGRRRLPLRVYPFGDLDPLAQPRHDLLYLPLSEVVEIPWPSGIMR